CRTFLEPGPPLNGDGEPDNRSALQYEVLHGEVPPGLIAYIEDRAVGWSRVGPRRLFPGVTGNRSLARVLADEPTAWWVTCFSTQAQARGLGVGKALLRADLEDARANGATVVEGYPVDVANLKAKRVGASALYTGTLRLFESAGFIEVARPSPTRPLMRSEF
ncbi:MAG: GNAT family N-acetyltransferase, partial [Actinomycetota bacterium]|nr:GNAT family N-acetyltransferase [Actinomycetota bacterium]